MRQIITGLVLAATLVIPVLAEEPPQFPTSRDKASYAVGVDFANSLRRQGVDLNAEYLARGLRDVLQGGTVLLSEHEIRATIQAFQAEFRAQTQENLRVQGEKNKVEGPAFLARNAKQDGVVTLPSGLQYKIKTTGTGPKPTADSSVKCHYRGTFLDGTEFDSSYSRNQPAVFPVRGVIAGWTEALQLMPVGSTWTLFVPYELAYGAGGSPPRIPPYTALVFEVELLSIEEAETTQPARRNESPKH